MLISPEQQWLVVVQVTNAQPKINSNDNEFEFFGKTEKKRLVSAQFKPISVIITFLSP